jgi:hypothetical protein
MGRALTTNPPWFRVPGVQDAGSDQPAKGIR